MGEVITITQKNERRTRHNFTPRCSGFVSAETAASWGEILQFGFIANSGDRNEVGIAGKICVGYKGEFFI